MNFLRQYLAAVRNFTRLPMGNVVAQFVGPPSVQHRVAVVHLPGVGWLVGLVACFAFAVFGIALPSNPFSPLASAVLCVGLTLALFGARDEDYVGALSGSAVMPLAVLLLAKVALLAVLAAHSPGAVLSALFAGHVVSRFWPVLLPRTLPFVSPLGAPESAVLPRALDNRLLLVSLAWCVVPLAVAAWAKGWSFAVVAVVASGLAFLVLQRTFARRLHGFTREAFGVVQPCCEVAFYFGAAAGLGTR